MRAHSKRWVAWIVAAALVLTAAGCGDDSDNSSGKSDDKGTEAGEPKRGGVLRAFLNVEPVTLDPIKTALNLPAPATLGYAVYGALVTVDSVSGKVENGIAESLTSPDEGKTWVLKLRSGVKFSDGTPLDAEAVKFNWDRNADQAAGSNFFKLSQGLTYTVDDPRTITITPKSQNSLFNRVLAQSGGYTFVASPTALKAKGADFGTAPVGAGPFVLKQWVKGSQFDFERNPSYWDSPRPHLDGMTARVLEEQRWESFQAGEADTMWANNPQDAESAKARSDLKVDEVIFVGSRGLGFNTTVAPTDDPDIRKALILAANRDELEKLSFPGLPTAHSLFVEKSPYHGTKFPAENVAEAQRLVDAYVAEKGGPVKVKVSYPSANPAYGNLAQALQSQWQRVKNLAVEIEGLESPAYLNPTGNRKFQIAAAFVLPGSHPDPRVFDVFHSSAGASDVYIGYDNPEVDKLLTEARTTTDVKEQEAAYKAVEKHVTEDSLVLPIGRIGNWQISYEHVQGMQFFADSAFRSDLVWLDK